MIRAMRQVRRGRPVGERAQPLPRHVLAVHDTDRPFRPRARARHGAAIRREVRVEAREMVRRLHTYTRRVLSRPQCAYTRVHVGPSAEQALCGWTRPLYIDNESADDAACLTALGIVSM